MQMTVVLYLTQEELQAFALAGMLRQDVQVLPTTVDHFGLHTCCMKRISSACTPVASYRSVWLAHLLQQKSCFGLA